MTKPSKIGEKSVATPLIVLNSMAIGVACLNLQGEFCYCNGRCLVMLGFETPDELLGQHVSLLFQKSESLLPELKGEPSKFSEVLDQKRSLHHAGGVFWRSDGRRLDVEYWCEPLVADGKVTGAVLCFTDVAARREEHAYRDQLAKLVESSHDAILSKDLNGKITSWNQGATEIYGYELEEAIGQRISIILPDGQTSEEAEIAEAILRGNELKQFMVTRQRKDGRIREISITASPIFDSDERVIGSCSIERDVTQQRQNQDDIIRAMNAAEHAKTLANAANRSRAEFLANISHELRTPMNAILGMLQLSLDEEQLNPTISDYLKTAKTSANSLLALVNEILDFSKIESGKFEIINSPFEVRGVIDTAAKALSPLASEKGLEIFCEVESGIPTSLIGDGRRIQQVVSNLLSNAVKFTERGEVVIQVTQARKLPGEVRLRFNVIDTGIGIAKADQERVFSPFAQADMSSTRQQHGTGLGLSICRELIALMGGSLQLESEVGRGSRFWFELSLPVDDSSRPADRVPAALARDLKVLIVDDNPTNLRILEKIFVSWSVQPIVAENAEQAQSILSETMGTDNQVSLAIFDGLMPGVDGFKLAEEIADRYGLGNPPVVIMQAAADLALFSEKKANAPVANYLTKPVSQSELLEIVIDTLDLFSRPAHRAGADVLVEPWIRPLRILLVEDLPANQKVAKAILEKRGHQVVVVPNGRLAVDLVQGNNEKIDVVLMDIQMPVMDGYQATTAIRRISDSAISQIPIIAMTAHAMQGDREACLSAGMDAYIAKPLDAKNLVDLVEAIPTRPDSISGGRETSRSQEDSGETLSEEQDHFELLDLEGSLNRLGGDQDLFREFVEIFREDAPGLLKSLVQSVKANDAGELERSAHALKGLISNFGAIRCVEVAQQIENAGKEKKIQSAEPILKPFQELYRRLWSELDGFASN